MRVFLAPSGPPQNVVLTVTDNTILTLSWEPPAEDLQNGAITAYTINCTSDSGRLFAITVDAPQNISVGVFSVLEVSCGIYASTAVGPGPTVTTSVTVPGKC